MLVHSPRFAYSLDHTTRGEYSPWLHTVDLWVQMALTRPHGFSVRSLHLYGPSGVGKTTAVSNIIGEHGMASIFLVGGGPFAFEGLDVDAHKFVIFEGFRVADWTRQLDNVCNLISGKSFLLKREVRPAVR